MKICFMCDLHLPAEMNTLQYKVLDWAIEDIRKKEPGCIVCAGDITCDGNLAVYEMFLGRMNSIGIPFLYIPGNSDLRCNETSEAIAQNASPCENIVEDVEIIALNDCDQLISEQQYAVLEKAADRTIVFMHHPIQELKADHRQRMLEWRENHRETLLFYAYLHRSLTENNSIGLQALDPDKAIGECPCLTYFDTDTKEQRKTYYFCPVPQDIDYKFGISCYRPETDIAFAIANCLKHLELRPDIVKCDCARIKALIDRWRNNGGESLSIISQPTAISIQEVIFSGDKKS